MEKIKQGKGIRSLWGRDDREGLFDKAAFKQKPVSTWKSQKGQNPAWREFIQAQRLRTGHLGSTDFKEWKSVFQSVEVWDHLHRQNLGSLTKFQHLYI